MHSGVGVEQTVDEASGADQRQLVVFRLAAELYGIEIARVHEIIRMQPVTRGPRAPAYVDGVSDVLRVSTSAIEPPSPVVHGIDSDYLHGIAELSERLVILLDLDRVLARDERRALEAAA